MSDPQHIHLIGNAEVLSDPALYLRREDEQAIADIHSRARMRAEEDEILREADRIEYVLLEARRIREERAK